MRRQRVHVRRQRVHVRRHFTAHVLHGALQRANLLLQGAQPPFDLRDRVSATLQAGTGREGSAAIQRGNAPSMCGRSP